MNWTEEDIEYLENYFANCRKKGHIVSSWGGMMICSVCGSASYVLWKKCNNTSEPKINPGSYEK
jgi:hypothetical protein